MANFLIQLERANWRSPGLGWGIWWNWTSGATMHECGGRPELNFFNFGLEICAHWNKKMRCMEVVLDLVGVKL